MKIKEAFRDELIQKIAKPEKERQKIRQYCKMDSFPLPLYFCCPTNSFGVQQDCTRHANARLSIPLNLLGAIYGGAVHNDSFVVFTTINDIYLGMH